MEIKEMCKKISKLGTIELYCDRHDGTMTIILKSVYGNWPYDEKEECFEITNKDSFDNCVKMFWID